MRSSSVDQAWPTTTPLRVRIALHTGEADLIAGDYYGSAVNRCAPPANRPTTGERDSCLPYLVEELRALDQVRALVCLGSFAWHGALLALAALGDVARPRPEFGHAAEARVGSYVLVGSYHPSQQNTFTGRLTPAMLQAVMHRAREVAGLPAFPAISGGGSG